MGYDKSLFELQPVSEDFLCQICQEVLQDPYTANPCEHTYCLGCIVQCYQNNNNLVVCSVCHVTITTSDLKPTMRAFRNILGRLRIRCKFELCSEVVQLKQFEQHLLDCAENPDNKPKPCPKQCGANISKEDYAKDEHHDCVAFLQNQILSLTTDKSQLEREREKLTSEIEKLRQENLQFKRKEKLKEFFERLEFDATNANVEQNDNLFLNLPSTRMENVLRTNSGLKDSQGFL